MSQEDGPNTAKRLYFYGLNDLEDRLGSSKSPPKVVYDHENMFVMGWYRNMSIKYLFIHYCNTI